MLFRESLRGKKISCHVNITVCLKKKKCLVLYISEDVVDKRSVWESVLVDELTDESITLADFFVLSVQALNQEWCDM